MKGKLRQCQPLQRIDQKGGASSHTFRDTASAKRLGASSPIYHIDSVGNTTAPQRAGSAFQVDWSLIDIILVDNSGRSLGTPSLTVITDALTHQVKFSEIRVCQQQG